MSTAPTKNKMETCCTCATVLSQAPSYHPDKAMPEDRRVPCCGRVICGNCIHKNRRFADYCPFCQVTNEPSLLPQRLKEPPLYTSVPSSSSTTPGAPPPYTPSKNQVPRDPTDEKAAFDEKPAEDTLHFLNHEHDTIASLSLRYNVPANALRRANNIHSDYLLGGRKTVLIPGEYYKAGVSLSPTPIDGEEEEVRKGKIRRFMTSCKVAEYDVAVLYLEQSGYDVDAATEAYVGDEEWERTHPKDGKRSAAMVKQRYIFGRS